MTIKEYSLEARALSWLRFEKQCEIVVLESPCKSHADVLGLNEKEGKVIEIEVKRSKSDFLADFKNKVKKHYHLSNSLAGPFKSTHFYFLVTDNIKDFVIAHLKENNYLKYGVLVVSSNRNKYLTVAHKATQLHKRPVITGAYTKLLTKRMASMIANHYLINDEEVGSGDN